MSNFTIGLVKIPVTNFEAATHYYREVIGLEEEFAVEAFGWPLVLSALALGPAYGLVAMLRLRSMTS